MNQILSNKMLKRYSQVGLVYGLGRSVYWLSNLNDSTYTINPITSRVEDIVHKPTTTSIVYYTIMNTCMSQLLWPFFGFSDLSYYEKSKMNIREIRPPFPFEQLKWREEKK
jgi:hypothetical protein